MRRVLVTIVRMATLPSWRLASCVWWGANEREETVSKAKEEKKEKKTYLRVDGYRHRHQWCW